MIGGWAVFTACLAMPIWHLTTAPGFSFLHGKFSESTENLSEIIRLWYKAPRFGVGMPIPGLN